MFSPQQLNRTDGSGCDEEDSDSNSDGCVIDGTGNGKLSHHRNSELDASLSRLALLEQELNNFEDNYVSRISKNGGHSAMKESSKLDRLTKNYDLGKKYILNIILNTSKRSPAHNDHYWWIIIMIFYIDNDHMSTTDTRLDAVRRFPKILILFC